MCLCGVWSNSMSLVNSSSSAVTGLYPMWYLTECMYKSKNDQTQPRCTVWKNWSFACCVGLPLQSVADTETVSPLLLCQNKLSSTLFRVQDSKISAMFFFPLNVDLNRVQSPKSKNRGNLTKLRWIGCCPFLPLGGSVYLKADKEAACQGWNSVGTFWWQNAIKVETCLIC